MKRRPKLIFIHSSDELYGAVMLLEMVGALPPGVKIEVWLPNDLTHPEAPLCEGLDTSWRGSPTPCSPHHA